MIYTLDSALKSRGVLSAANMDDASGCAGKPLDGQTFIDLENTVGINRDLAFSQACIESAYGTSDYWLTRNNPAGIGAIDSAPGNALSFDTPRDGIIAMIAHLLTYTDGAANPMKLSDPRYSDVSDTIAGTIKTIGMLGNGVWASDPGYAGKIVSVATSLIARYTGGGGSSMSRIIVSAGHENIGAITADKIGLASADELRDATGALGTEASYNGPVADALCARLTAAGVTAVRTDADYHADLFNIDADLFIAIHADGFSGVAEHQWCGAAVVASGDPTDAANQTAQTFVDTFDSVYGPIVGVSDFRLTSNPTVDMTEYYGGWYRTANTPMVLIECGVWGDATGQRKDVPNASLAAHGIFAVLEKIGVVNGNGGNAATGTDGPGSGETSGGNGESTDGDSQLDISGYVARDITPGGDGRGFVLAYPGNDPGYRVGHGFADEYTAGDFSVDGINHGLEEYGVPLTPECVIVEDGKPLTVQVFERDVFTWDGTHVSRLDLGRQWRDANIVRLPTTTYRG